MPRSAKKVFFVDPHLMDKVDAAQATDNLKPIRT
jgi:ribosomal protein S19